MSIETIIGIVVKVVSLIGYVLLAILAIKRKKITIKSDDSDVNWLDVVIEKVRDGIKTAETTYNTIFKEGVKAGTFKLKDVLEIAKDTCLELDKPFDKDYWTEFIKSEVDLMNFGSGKQVQSTEKRIVTIEGVVKNESKTDL